MRGRIIPQIEPVGGTYSHEELTDLFGQIDEVFDARDGCHRSTKTQRTRMSLLLYGKRPLSPEKHCR